METITRLLHKGIRQLFCLVGTSLIVSGIWFSTSASAESSSDTQPGDDLQIEFSDWNCKGKSYLSEHRLDGVLYQVRFTYDGWGDLLYLKIDAEDGGETWSQLRQLYGKPKSHQKSDPETGQKSTDGSALVRFCEADDEASCSRGFLMEDWGTSYDITINRLNFKPTIYDYQYIRIERLDGSQLVAKIGADDVKDKTYQCGQQVN